MGKDIDIKEEVVLDEFDEEIEGYATCGNSNKKYKCKKDCFFGLNAVISGAK